MVWYACLGKKITCKLLRSTKKSRGKERNSMSVALMMKNGCNGRLGMIRLASSSNENCHYSWKEDFRRQTGKKEETWQQKRKETSEREREMWVEEELKKRKKSGGLWYHWRKTKSESHDRIERIWRFGGGQKNIYLGKERRQVDRRLFMVSVETKKNEKFKREVMGESGE